MTSKTGILLTNIGTPADPSPATVKKYLQKFLSDKRVVNIPPVLWQPILRGLILPLRSKKSAKLYQKIWTEEGSPLLVITQRIAEKLQKKLTETAHVALGMHYSQPSIKNALESLRKKNCEKIIVLPLYPQHSSAATGSSFNQVMDVLKTWQKLPEVHFMNDYADHPLYIEAIANSIKQNKPTQYLLFSFHGIPLRSVKQGDPYGERCHLTAKLVAEKLQLKPNQWSIAFQSRLGRAKWLAPYTDMVLKKLPQQGITELSVISPGFSADCLETLEEIAIRGKEQFIKAGGKKFNYISALNDNDEQIALLSDLCK